MCQFACFFHNPSTQEIKVKVLDSHGDTEKQLKLNPKVWREGHYLPNGEIELRLTDDDRVDRTEYETAFHNRFPTFVSFFNWAIKEIGAKEHYKGTLDLNRLTSARGLTLPESVGGSLSLNRLTNAEGLTLPKSVGGWLSLDGLTSADGLTLPKGFKGKIYVSKRVKEEIENKRRG